MLRRMANKNIHNSYVIKFYFVVGMNMNESYTTFGDIHQLLGIFTKIDSLVIGSQELKRLMY